MARLRDTGVLEARREAAEQDPVKTRADALGDAAFKAKRAAEGLVEQEENRQRVVAGIAGGGGLLGLALGVAAVLDLGPPALLLPLAAIAGLVPTVHALLETTARGRQLTEAAYERGFCQALAHHAKRLGDAVGATDTRNLPLGPTALITGQLDILHRDLDRTKHRLEAAGADLGAPVAVRLHDSLVPEMRDTFLGAGDGRRYPVRIVEVSLSGVAVKGQLPPLAPGDEVQVGGRRARVTRAGTGEVAAQFVHALLPSELTRRIVL